MSKNVLFVCKHNRFRSKVAEAFFNKYNKNKNYTASSAGIIIGDYPFDYLQKKVAEKEFGLRLLGKPRPISLEILEDIDIVVIVADNVPLSLFHGKKYGNKKVVWAISDVRTHTYKEVKEIISRIEKKVIKFVESLK